MDDVGLFVANGRVIACDLKEAILDNQFSEYPVNVSILYCLNNILAFMTIWKWSLVQTIMDGYSMRQLLVSYNETTFQLLMTKKKVV
jgi:hypothetical protein